MVTLTRLFATLETGGALSRTLLLLQDIDTSGLHGGNEETGCKKSITNHDIALLESNLNRSQQRLLVTALATKTFNGK